MPAFFTSEGFVSLQGRHSRVKILETIQTIHQYIKKLINNYTIETTPNVYEKFESLGTYLPHGNDVYITYLPDEDPKRIIDTAKKIIQEGLEAIPHLSSRTIKDYNMLEKYIGNLSEKAGCKKILVIGGSGKQIGNINSSLEFSYNYTLLISDLIM